MHISSLSLLRPRRNKVIDKEKGKKKVSADCRVALSSYEKIVSILHNVSLSFLFHSSKGIRCTNASELCAYVPFCIWFFRFQNIHDVYFHSSTTLLLLENVINGQKSVKYPTCVKVSNLVVTFFNGMCMNELRYKRQGYHEIKKSSRAKWDIRAKLKS